MRAVIAAAAPIAWIAIEAMVLLNPSSTIGYRLDAPWAAAFFLASPLLVLGAFVLCSRRSGAAAFFMSLGLSLLVLVLLSWWAGLRIHRDFFTFPAQLVILFTSLVLIRLDDLDIVKRKPESYRALYAGAMAMFGLWILWLMLMSYAIVARTEPRWIESSAYNLINGVIGVLLAFSASMLRNQAKRIVRIEDGSLFLDRRNISDILSPQESRLAKLFIVEPGRALGCEALVSSLNGDFPSPSGQASCGECKRNGWNASKCGAFRNLKNRINEVKKFLELLQIGTIVPVSENVRDIKLSGWRMRLFDDVRYASRAKKAHVRQ